MRTKTSIAVCIMLVALNITGAFAAEDQAAEKLADFPLVQTVLLEVDNATLSDVARLIEKQTGITMIVDPELGEASLSMKMINAPLLQCLSLIEQLVENVSVQVSAGGSFQELDRLIIRRGFTELPKDRQHKQGATMAILFKAKYRARRNKDLREPLVNIYYVSPILDGASWNIDDLATALDTAWKIRSDVKDGEATFHKETGLLMCKGSMDALKIADQIIGQMPNGGEVVMRSLIFRGTNRGEPAEELSSSLRKFEVLQRMNKGEWTPAPEETAQ